MLYLWFKSDDGDKLEDSGIVEAENTCKAQDILYEEYGYDNNMKNTDMIIIVYV